MSRLDINACQTSIKISVLLIYFGNPHPGYQRHKTPHLTVVVPTELNKRGVVKRTNSGLQNTYQVSYNKNTDTKQS